MKEFGIKIKFPHELLSHLEDLDMRKKKPTENGPGDIKL